MYILKLKHHFDSAHQLMLTYDSPCQNIHGHRWEVLIEISCKDLNANGMIVDFKQLKSIVDELDHQFLNDVVEFNPTAENISKYLYNKIKLLMAETESFISVTINESPEASITYEN